MRNEKETLLEFNEKLNKQLNFFEANYDYPLSMLKGIKGLESRYNIPLLINFYYDENKYHTKAPKGYVLKIEDTLNKFIKLAMDEDYSIKFLNLKNMTYSMLYTDIEIVRFSLMKESYAFTTSIYSDVRYEKVFNASKIYMKTISEDILKLDDKKLQIEKVLSNRFSLISLIKTKHDIVPTIKLLIDPKLKQKLNKTNSDYNSQINIYKEQLQNEEIRNKSITETREWSKELILDVNLLFKEIGYVETDINLFYY